MNMIVEFDNVVNYDTTTLAPKLVKPTRIDLASFIGVMPAHNTAVEGDLRSSPQNTMQYAMFGRGGVNLQFLVSEETANDLVSAFNRHFCRGSRAALREVNR